MNVTGFERRESEMEAKAEVASLETTELTPWLATLQMPSGQIIKLPFATEEIANTYIEFMRRQSGAATSWVVCSLARKEPR